MSAVAHQRAARGSLSGRRAAPLVLFLLGLLGLLAGGLLSAVAAQPEQPVNLSRTLGPSEEPAVATSGADALVSWTEGEQIWHARRVAGAWLPAAPIPGAVGSTPAVAAAPDGTFHVAWSGFSLVDENYEIYHSHLSGGAWNLPETVSGTVSDSVEPDIAARTDGTLLLVWTELEAEQPHIVAATQAPGAGWSSGPVPDADGTTPAVAASGAEWHLAWSQAIEPGQATEVVAMHRTAAGWGLPEVVSSSPAVTSSDASLVLDASGSPAIAWLEGDGHIGFSRRLPGGWTAPRALVSATLAAPGSPALAASGDRFDVAWAGATDVNVLFDVADTPSAAVMAMSFARRARGAAVLPDGDGLLVVAEGREDTDAGDIYAVRVPAPDVEVPTSTPIATSTAEATGTTASTTATPTPETPAPSPEATMTVPALPSPTTVPPGLIYLPITLRAVRIAR